MTPPRACALIAVATLCVASACAPRPSRSELEWQRAQCAQILDKEARERCLDRVDRQ